jgi:flavin reductase (DIM6/NTAB) family NADH-FMN oxidoreductase RutF
MSFTVATDPKELNRTLFQITHGLYVLTAAAGNRLNGQCLDALMQVTSRPPRVAIAVNKRTLTHEMISSTGHFIVNVLDRENHDCPQLIQHFGFQSGHTVDKFAQLPHELGENGLPILPDAKAFYECRVISEMTLDLDTHTLFIASVDRAGIRGTGTPLTYNEYREKIKKRRE